MPIVLLVALGLTGVLGIVPQCSVLFSCNQTMFVDMWVNAALTEYHHSVNLDGDDTAAKIAIMRLEK